MDYDTIRGKINRDEYRSKVEYPTEKRVSESHVFNEEKSVKWNREEVERYNNAIYEQKMACHNSERAGYEEFTSDITSYLFYAYGFNAAMASKIYSKAYDRGHSSGYNNILEYVDEYADFAKDMIDLSK